MNVKKVALVMTALMAVTALASCRRSNPTSSTSGSEPTSGSTSGSQTSTSGQPATDWSEESKKIFEENLLFSLPYFQGAEAFVESGIVMAEGTAKATVTDVDKYCETLEKDYVQEWEEEEQGKTYKMRSVVTALEEVSYDAETYFGLNNAAEYRLTIEFYDEQYKEWGAAYYVEQDIYFGIDPSNSRFAVYSVLNYNVYSAVFGVSFDGTGAYKKSVYQYFDTNDTSVEININTFVEIEFKEYFDGEFITPEFMSDEDDAMVLPADFQYLYPYLYGNGTSPIFSTYLGLVYGSETEHDSYIDDVLVFGYSEVNDPDRVIEGTRLFELVTTNGVCEIEVDDYDEQAFDFGTYGILPGYGVTFTFLLNE